MGPCKAIMVLLEEFDESSAELRTKASSYLDFVIRIVRVDAYVIELVDAQLVGV